MKPVVSGPRKFHRLGFPDKLDHVRNNHNIEASEGLSAQALSINAARNCLVHRSGVVAEKDLGGDGVLEVKWRLVMVLQTDGEERELSLGERIEKDSIVGIRNQEACKAFKLGERVEFTPEEFANICWGLFLFGNEIVRRIGAFGKKEGFITEKPESA